MSTAPTPPPPPPPARRGLLGCAFLLSLLLNLIVLGLVVLGCLVLFLRPSWFGSSGPLSEVHYSGDKGASSRIAVIRLDGFILEGTLGYVHRQIEQAARDDTVKAVVLRINSPGGSITASDDLHRRLSLLAQGDSRKNTHAKPLVASMASLAASGAYYAAMPAAEIFAERTTMTGSIGVFMSLPNLKGTAEHIGFRLDTIKQGEIKDSGSPFRDLTPKERQVWQDLVDHAYEQFVAVVEEGRPQLRGQLLAMHTLRPIQAGPDKAKPPEPYQRYLADGGIWAADKALEFKLIDHIGSLDDAVTAVGERVGLGSHFEVIQYERPLSLRESLIGIRAPETPAGSLDLGRWSNALGPRLWYLAPGHEAAAFAAALNVSQDTGRFGE
jgi:protease-4